MSKSSKTPKKLPVAKKPNPLKLSADQFFILLGRFAQSSETNLAETQALRQQAAVQTEAILSLGNQIIVLTALLEKAQLTGEAPAVTPAVTPADLEEPAPAVESAPAANDAIFSNEDEVPSPASLESLDREAEAA